MFDQFDDDAVGYGRKHPAVVASLEALRLERKTWEMMRDECLAWARVFDNIDPGLASNTGQRNICWTKHANGQGKGGPTYTIRRWIDGELKLTHMAAPKTLAEARAGSLLERAIAKRDEYPSPSTTSLPMGAMRHVMAILGATPEGRAYVEATTPDSVQQRVRMKGKCGQHFGADGWHRKSSISAHMLLFPQPDCDDLLSGGISKLDAEALVRRRNEDKRLGLRLVKPPRRPQTANLVIDNLTVVESRGMESMFRRGLTFEQVWHAWGTLMVAAADNDERVAS